MRSVLCSVYLDLQIQRSPFGVIKCGTLWAKHARIGHHGGIRGEAGFISHHKRQKIRTTDLLFTFKKAFDVDRQRTLRLQVCFQRLDMSEHLSLVVASPAAEEIV